MNANRCPEQAIVVSELVKRFGTFTAVDRVSFEVCKGEIFGFLGPNGSGKSTTIRMLCGLLMPTSGSGTVVGCDIVKQPREIQTRIGYMSQQFSLYDDLTVLENLAFYAGVYTVEPARLQGRIDEVLELVDLSAERDIPARVLSTGFKQRLALGCAVVHNPGVLFLDEPTSGVDPVARRRFWDLIDGLARNGVTVLVTTHVMEEAEYCNRLVMIDRGRRVALGSPAELKRDYRNEILEVLTGDATAAMLAADGWPDVEEAALFGDALHITTAPHVRTADEWILRFRSAGVEVRNVRPVEVTLEDVFVSLANRKDPEPVQPGGMPEDD